MYNHNNLINKKSYKLTYKLLKLLRFVLHKVISQCEKLKVQDKQFVQG